MRKLMRLMALLGVLGVFSVAAPIAAAEEAPPGASPIAEEATSIVELPIPGPGEMAPMDQIDCPANAMCVWQSRNYDGNFSWWPESNTGCHPHPGNPEIRSGWNRTAYRVRLGGAGYVQAGHPFFVPEGQGPIYGEICWPE